VSAEDDGTLAAVAGAQQRMLAQASYGLDQLVPQFIATVSNAAAGANLIQALLQMPGAQPAPIAASVQAVQPELARYAGDASDLTTALRQAATAAQQDADQIAATVAQLTKQFDGPDGALAKLGAAIDTTQAAMRADLTGVVRGGETLADGVRRLVTEVVVALVPAASGSKEDGDKKDGDKKDGDKKAPGNGGGASPPVSGAAGGGGGAAGSAAPASAAAKNAGPAPAAGGNAAKAGAAKGDGTGTGDDKQPDVRPAIDETSGYAVKGLNAASEGVTLLDEAAAKYRADNAVLAEQYQALAALQTELAIARSVADQSASYAHCLQACGDAASVVAATWASIADDYSALSAQLATDGTAAVALANLGATSTHASWSGLSVRTQLVKQTLAGIGTFIPPAN
jgi:hypothetical protein